MLEVSQLYYSKAGKTLINNLSFTLSPGRFVCIIGDNGAGKSTLIHILSGRLQQDSGSVKIQGKEVSEYRDKPLARERSVLFQHNPQDIPFPPRLLMDISRYAWKGIQEGREVLKEQLRLLDQCQALHFIDREMLSLSGGEQQRVHLARALYQRNLEAPSLILMDEPFNHLDLKHRHRAMHNLMALCSKGYTAVIVLHDLQFALQYADDVLLLKQGQLLAFGSAQNVMTAENLSHAFEIPFQVFSTSAFPFPLVFPMAHADSNDNRFSIPNTQTLQAIV